MSLGASSGTLYEIKSVVPYNPLTGSLFVVPGTTFVSPLLNLSANGCDAETPLTSK
jgi:hypothetical protein